MDVSNEQLIEIVVKPGHVSEETFAELQKESELRNQKLSDLLVERGAISDEQLGQLVADYHEVPYVNLRLERIDLSTLSLLPLQIARKSGAVAFKKEDDIVHLGMLDPTNLDIYHSLSKYFGKRVKTYYVTHEDFIESISKYNVGLDNSIKKIIEKIVDPEITEDQRDQFIIEIVNLLLQYGHENKSSDIHIEPREEILLVRFRIDGIMQDVTTIPKNLSDSIITRIKILSNMRTDERRSAQDGKLRFATKGIKNDIYVDVRVSVLPVTGGENVVMRILSAESRAYGLSGVGFNKHDLREVEIASSNPHGMILVTGPTGSGKTTTLYSVLKKLNTRDVHIATIEDPVEYDIEGVSQVQVNPRTNLTFAKGLRAIVRQDPDIIMVGEIRDEETAGIAVNAAMTGHLVLSTLHTNDAATAIPRLLDMEIEPFLIASTVNVIIAQRLVRKICQRCRVSCSITPEESDILERNHKLSSYLTSKGYEDIDNLILFTGPGCKVCGGTGYSGRTGIFEVLPVDDEVKKMIKNKATSDSIKEYAVSQGMTTMMEDGIDKVILGITSFEEVMRVTLESVKKE